MKHCVRAVQNKCVGHQHLKNPNLRDCGSGERLERKELNQKTAALDKERYEVACLRQDIIDEYEKKSAELLEYLNSMELAFDRQRLEFEDREAQLLAENSELKNELEGGCRAHLQEHISQEEQRQKREWEAQRAMEQLKDEHKRTEKLLKKGQKRLQELDAELNDLREELQRKDDLFYHRTKMQERRRKSLEMENANLKRKAALGWMIGSLSELFLRLDPEVGVGSVLKLVRKVQKELECGNNVFDCHVGQAPKVEYDIIQKEIRRLLNHRSPVSRTLHRVPSCCLIKDKPGKVEFFDPRRKRVCKGRHWRPPSGPDATLKAAAGRLECEAAEQSDSPLCTSAPETPGGAACQTPCLLLDTPFENCSTSSCHAPSQINLINEKKSLRETHTPPSWTPAHDYASYTNRRQSLKRMLRHLEASMTFILGQERRRRKVEGRNYVNKPTKRGVACCKHQDSSIL
ncbi:hypothetical protein MPTK1_1g15590 [Marchantia polymorpha subsp. ruderalis]|uniref:Uncharacterized protein n=2 Tax=Marchantia polymorpha TaxID=3197 RepID=A0AAF6AQI2_MARPO|nr:hypothetical protein MARPO_0033s0102 [Marchantia polymorpha]BBM98702.1 hypothetical protein Mp_1g15590 [Marchantia polymorpha subsp. ruderalis]|eukprot:PTQ41704.1 hypothetical protein MARPO_0033s0102 [Marchantia polymorpha]